MNKKATKLLRKISQSTKHYKRLKKVYKTSGWIDKTKILKGIRQGIDHAKKYIEENNIKKPDN